MLGLPCHTFAYALNHCVDFVSFIVYEPTATYLLSSFNMYTSFGRYSSGMW